MTTIVMTSRNKIHPHKFTLWVGIGSIIMMFAGLTSAYIVKRNQANWTTFELPVAFWYSTVVIIASSITLLFASNSFRARQMSRYRLLTAITLILGVVFLCLQVAGFSNLWSHGITLQANVSFSFLYVIVGLHGLHVLGGVIALISLSLKAFNKRIKNYSVIPLELVSTYWHFVDLLWLYLLIFLVMIR